MAEGHLLLDNLQSMWWIAAAASLAPVLAILTRRVVPDVVWLLTLGVIIGPNVFGIAGQTEAVEFLSELGVGFLFLLAGFELNTSHMRSRQGKHAALTWIICAVLGVGAGLLLVEGDVRAAIVIALASTSTALGVLLPILKDSGLIAKPLGEATMVHGAWGELLPIVAMSLLLSTRATWEAAAVLILFAVTAVLAVVVPARLFQRVPLLARAFTYASNTTMQTTLRLTVFLLITLMLLTAALDLDVALGAFTAGILASAGFRAAAPKHADEIAHKLEIVGFSLLVPVFFVTSGMSIDILAVLREWPMLLGFVVMIAIVRGVPIIVREFVVNTDSGIPNAREKVSLGLFASTGLPIIVAVTYIGVSAEIITATSASVMVTAGAVTVLIFPMIAQRLVKSTAGTSAGPQSDAAGTSAGPQSD
ncbi:MAG: cation:proton antiporter [Cumulibacter sp.]